MNTAQIDAQNEIAKRLWLQDRAKDAIEKMLEACFELYGAENTEKALIEVTHRIDATTRDWMIAHNKNRQPKLNFGKETER